MISLEIVYRNMLLKDKNAIAIYSDEEIVCAVHAVETARKQLKQGVSASYSIKNLTFKNRRITVKVVGIKFMSAGSCTIQSRRYNVKMGVVR